MVILYYSAWSSLSIHVSLDGKLITNEEKRKDYLRLWVFRGKIS